MLGIRRWSILVLVEKAVRPSKKGLSSMTEICHGQYLPQYLQPIAVPIVLAHPQRDDGSKVGRFIASIVGKLE